MNYIKIYNDIIEKAKSQNRKRLKKTSDEYIYYENHHILPKCLNGDDSKNNLVLLTPKEHYVCHKLLICMYKNNISLIYAFFMMSHFKKYGNFITLRDYANIRNLISLTPITEEKRKNLKLGIKKRKPISEETRRKMSEARKGKASVTKGKSFSEETKKKMSASQFKRLPPSKETREKIRNSKKGKPIGIGRHLSKEHKNNISKVRKGKPANNKGKILFYENGKRYYIEKV
jgi:hypothetical protein